MGLFFDKRKNTILNAEVMSYLCEVYFFHFFFKQIGYARSNRKGVFNERSVGNSELVSLGVSLAPLVPVGNL